MRLVPRAGIDGPFAGISSVSYGLSQVEILCKLIGCRVLEVKQVRKRNTESKHACWDVASELVYQNWFSFRFLRAVYVPSYLNDGFFSYSLDAMRCHIWYATTIECIRFLKTQKSGRVVVLVFMSRSFQVHNFFWPKDLEIPLEEVYIHYIQCTIAIHQSLL